MSRINGVDEHRMRGYNENFSHSQAPGRSRQGQRMTSLPLVTLAVRRLTIKATAGAPHHR